MKSVAPLALLLVVAGCEAAPSTDVVLDNDYPPDAASSLVVYAAHWQAVTFRPVAPGTSSDPQPTVPASDNTAYVVLAPGWDPAGGVAPVSYVVMQSRAGYGVRLGQTLHVPVNDATFAGNCAAGSPLTQAEANFVTLRVFPCLATLRYDAATCTTVAVPDAAACVDGG